MNSLYLNTTGSNNVATGINTLRYSVTGSNNAAHGAYALYNNESATSSTAVGLSAARGTTNYYNQGGVYLGFQAGYSASNASDYNTLLGYQAGYGITTGSNNIWIGTATSSTSIANLTTGSQNILIGNNISLPSATANGQLNIGNIIFGTSITGTGSTVSSGNLGLATTTPRATLDVYGSVVLEGTSYITTSSLGGGALLAGACSSVSTAATGLSSTTAFMTTPKNDPGDGFFWSTIADSATSARTRVCASVAGTPNASVYNVKIIH
jgi:hypothetical protein